MLIYALMLLKLIKLTSNKLTPAYNSPLPAFVYETRVDSSCFKKLKISDHLIRYRKVQVAQSQEDV